MKATVNAMNDVKILINKGLDIQRRVKINYKNERRFGVVTTPLSSCVRSN